MGGGSARRRAEEAAEASRREATNLREQTKILERRTQRDAKKASNIMMRALRARGGGFFQSDTSSTLG